MSKSVIQEFFYHKNRHWMVGVATFTLAIGLGIPTWDQMAKAKSSSNQLRESIREIALQATELPVLREEFKRGEENENRRRGIDEATAIQIRERIVAILRENGCRLLSVQLSDPQHSQWMPGMNPIGLQSATIGDDPKFELSTIKLSVIVEGNLKQVLEMTNAVQHLHEMAIPTRLDLQQQSNGHDLKLEVDLALIDLHLAKLSE